MGRIRRLLVRTGTAVLLALVTATGIAAAPATPPPDGFVPLSGAAGLPPYLRAAPTASADTHGLRGGNVYTVASDFQEHDFVYDVVFTFEGANSGDRTPELIVGIGRGPDGNSLSDTVGVRI